MSLLLKIKKMFFHKVSCLIVNGNDGEFIGLITERDIVSRVVASSLDIDKTTISTIMSTQIISCSPNTPSSEVREIMTVNQIRHLPIIEKGLESGKKILFVPDRCLGQNFAIQMGLKSCVIGVEEDGKECDPNEADIICFNGFCSVHQLFTVDDIEFYRNKYPDIKIAVHPECDPSVVAAADFSGSTSQLIKYVNDLDPEQKVAIGTEYNLVNRMRKGNTYVLSSTKPECPTMNETTLEDLYNTLKSIEDGQPINEIVVDPHTIEYANLALERMLAIK